MYLFPSKLLKNLYVACHRYVNKHQIYIKKILKKWKFDPFNSKKIQSNSSLNFLMVQGPPSVNNCDRQHENKNVLVLYKGKNRKIPIKSVKIEISKTKKNLFFFSRPKDHSTQKLGFFVKSCDLQPAHRHTDTHTDRQTDRWSDYCGHPFRVSGIFQPIIKDGSSK